MLRCCIIEFEGSWEKYLSLVEFAYNNNYQVSLKMTPYEALYGPKCRSLFCWSELSEMKLEGDDKVRPICDNLKAATDRQKSYADLKRKDIEFAMGDRNREVESEVYGLYEIIERVGPVAYRLALPPKLEKIHDVFNIRSSHVVDPCEVEIQHDLSYFEEPTKILACEVKELRNKKEYCGIVMGLKRLHGRQKELMKSQYPNLFSGKIFGDENFFRGESCNNSFSVESEQWFQDHKSDE
ncbi:pol protein [Gossypium australe]|uniref:Pol protein n=1 Tax=Gossypium australe TaxID=47621 RepID=A0A5B6WUQ9_9ROSI|nr:pol protein [Gossypium australe]